MSAGAENGPGQEFNPFIWIGRGMWAHNSQSLLMESKFCPAHKLCPLASCPRRPFLIRIEAVQRQAPAGRLQFAEAGIVASADQWSPQPFRHNLSQRRLLSARDGSKQYSCLDHLFRAQKHPSFRRSLKTRQSAQPVAWGAHHYDPLSQIADLLDTGNAKWRVKKVVK